MQNLLCKDNKKSCDDLLIVDTVFIVGSSRIKLFLLY